MYNSTRFFTGLLEKQNEVIMRLESENKILKDKLSRIFAILAEEYLGEYDSDNGVIMTLEDFIEIHRADIAGV